jgi:hypothetical protein
MASARNSTSVKAAPATVRVASRGAIPSAVAPTSSARDGCFANLVACPHRESGRFEHECGHRPGALRAARDHRQAPHHAIRIAHHARLAACIGGSSNVGRRVGAGSRMTAQRAFRDDPAVAPERIRQCFTVGIRCLRGACKRNVEAHRGDLALRQPFDQLCVDALAKWPSAEAFDGPVIRCNDGDSACRYAVHDARRAIEEQKICTMENLSRRHAPAQQHERRRQPEAFTHQIWMPNYR